MRPIGADHVVGTDGIVHARQCRASHTATCVPLSQASPAAHRITASRERPARHWNYRVAAARPGSNRTLKAPPLSFAAATDFCRSESGSTNDRR